MKKIINTEKFKKVKSKFKLNKKQTKLINRLGNILNKCQEANIEIFDMEGVLYATNGKMLDKYTDCITFDIDECCMEDFGIEDFTQLPLKKVPTGLFTYPCAEQPDFKNDFIKTFIKKSENADE